MDIDRRAMLCRTSPNVKILSAGRGATPPALPPCARPPGERVKRWVSRCVRRYSSLAERRSSVCPVLGEKNKFLAAKRSHRPSSGPGCTAFFPTTLLFLANFTPTSPEKTTRIHFFVVRIQGGTLEKFAKTSKPAFKFLEPT